MSSRFSLYRYVCVFLLFSIMLSCCNTLQTPIPTVTPTITLPLPTATITPTPSPLPATFHAADPNVFTNENIKFLNGVEILFDEEEMLIFTWVREQKSQESSEYWQGGVEDLLLNVKKQEGDWYKVEKVDEGRLLIETEDWQVITLKEVSLKNGVGVRIKLDQVSGVIGLWLRGSVSDEWEDLSQATVDFTGGHIRGLVVDGTKYPDDPWHPVVDENFGQIPADAEVQIQITRDEEKTNFALFDSQGNELGSFMADNRVFYNDFVAISLAAGPDTTATIEELELLRPEYEQLKPMIAVKVDGDWELREARQQEDGSWWIKTDGEWVPIVTSEGVVQIPGTKTVGEVDLHTLNEALKYFPPGVVDIGDILGEGYELEETEDNFEIRKEGELILTIDKSGLMSHELENGETIQVGIEYEKESDFAKDIPAGADMGVYKDYLAALQDGRITALRHEDRWLFMPGMDRPGASEVGLVVDEGNVIWVASKHGTELYSYSTAENEWKPAVDPNQETPFKYKGMSVKADFNTVEGVDFSDPENMYIKFRKRFRFIVKLNPEVILSSSYAGPTKLEGIIVSGDGQVTLVSFNFGGKGPDDSWAYQVGLDPYGDTQICEATYEQFSQALRVSGLAFGRFTFDIIEKRLKDYDYDLWAEDQLELERKGMLQYLEDPQLPWPYVFPVAPLSPSFFVAADSSE